MESSYSNQSSEEDHNSENELDQTIEVRRVREISEAFYSIEEYERAESDQDYEPQYGSLPSLQPDTPVQDFNSEDNVDSEPYRQSELSESATVVTLYYTDNTLRNNEVIIDDLFNNTKKNVKFRFTPAECKHVRARSAPAVHLTDFQAFKESKEFLYLEAAFTAANDLVLKSNGKLDLDPNEGQSAGKKFLDSIEVLVKGFLIPCKDRTYREKFSKAYKVLYQEESLCYLTEILNSAQEGYSYIIVNSEKYIFSSNVLKAGERLFNIFEILRDYIKDLYNL